MRIIVGAGDTYQVGWVPFTESQLDITRRSKWAALFQPASLDAILAEHVFEHLTPSEAESAARNFFEFLKPGGYLRLAVPDGLHASANYIRWVAPMTGFNGTDHKILFTYHSLSRLLQRAGFKVRLLEWFDEHGRLHRQPRNDFVGYISRAYGSPWSAVLSLVVRAQYTSLIADGFKLQ